MFNQHLKLNLSRSSSIVSISPASGDRPGNRNASPNLAQGALAGRHVWVSSPRMHTNWLDDALPAFECPLTLRNARHSPAGGAVRNNAGNGPDAFADNAASTSCGAFSLATMLSPRFNHAQAFQSPAFGQRQANPPATPETAASSFNRQHEQALPRANAAASREYRIPVQAPRQTAASALRHAASLGDAAQARDARELEAVVFEQAGQPRYELNVITGQFTRDGQPVTLTSTTSKTNSGKPLSLSGSHLDFFRILLIALDQQRRKTGEARLSLEEFQQAAANPRFGGSYNLKTITKLSGNVNRIFTENGIQKPVVKSIEKRSAYLELNERLINSENIVHSDRPADQQQFETSRAYRHAPKLVNNPPSTQSASQGQPLFADFGNGVTLDLSRNGRLLQHGSPVAFVSDRKTTQALAMLKEVLKLGKPSVSMAELEQSLSDSIYKTSDIRHIVHCLKKLMEQLGAMGVAPPINLPTHQAANLRHSPERTVELTATCKVIRAEPTPEQSAGTPGFIQSQPAPQRKRDQKYQRKDIERKDNASPLAMTQPAAVARPLSEETMHRLQSLNDEQRFGLLMELMEAGLTEDDVNGLQNFSAGDGLSDDEAAITVLERLEYRSPGAIDRAIDNVLLPEPVPPQGMIKPGRR